MTSFLGARELLKAELGRLDFLLHREILRLRADHLLSEGDLRGLYVSDAQVDALLRQAPSGEGQPLPDVDALTAEADRLRAVDAVRAAPHPMPLARVATLFGLLEFERDVLLLAIAPELDLRYEVFYSYMNNDVTRKRPTCDLALRLLCVSKEERWSRGRQDRKSN